MWPYLHVIWNIACIHSRPSCPNSALQLVRQIIKHLEIVSAFQCSPACAPMLMSTGITQSVSRICKQHGSGMLEWLSWYMDQSSAADVPEMTTLAAPSSGRSLVLTS